MTRQYLFNERRTGSRHPNNKDWLLPSGAKGVSVPKEIDGEGFLQSRHQPLIHPLIVWLSTHLHSVAVDRCLEGATVVAVMIMKTHEGEKQLCLRSIVELSVAEESANEP